MTETVCAQCGGEIDEPEDVRIREDLLFCCDDCKDDYFGEVEG